MNHTASYAACLSQKIWVRYKNVGTWQASDNGDIRMDDPSPWTIRPFAPMESVTIEPDPEDAASDIPGMAAAGYGMGPSNLLYGLPVTPLPQPGLSTGCWINGPTTVPVGSYGSCYMDLYRPVIAQTLEEGSSTAENADRRFPHGLNYLDASVPFPGTGQNLLTLESMEEELYEGETATVTLCWHAMPLLFKAYLYQTSGTRCQTQPVMMSNDSTDDGDITGSDRAFGKIESREVRLTVFDHILDGSAGENWADNELMLSFGNCWIVSHGAWTPTHYAQARSGWPMAQHAGGRCHIAWNAFEWDTDDP